MHTCKNARDVKLIMYYIPTESELDLKKIDPKTYGEEGQR